MRALLCCSRSEAVHLSLKEMGSKWRSLILLMDANVGRGPLCTEVLADTCMTSWVAGEHKLRGRLTTSWALRCCAGYGFYPGNVSLNCLWGFVLVRKPNVFFLQICCSLAVMLILTVTAVVWVFYLKCSWFFLSLPAGHNWHWLLIENHVFGGSNSE